MKAHPSTYGASSNGKPPLTIGRIKTTNHSEGDFNMEHRLCEGCSRQQCRLRASRYGRRAGNAQTAQRLKGRRGNSGQYLWPAAITFIHLNAWRAASSANSPGWLA